MATITEIPVSRRVPETKPAAPPPPRRKFHLMDLAVALVVLVICGISFLFGQHIRNRNFYGQRGDEFYVAEKYAKAIEEYTKALRHDPQSTLAYIRRAKAHFFLNHWNKTIADCNKALTIDPQLADVYWLRAQAHARTGNFWLARADYQRAIKLKPSLADR